MVGSTTSLKKGLHHVLNHKLVYNIWLNHQINCSPPLMASVFRPDSHVVCELKRKPVERAEDSGPSREITLGGMVKDPFFCMLSPREMLKEKTKYCPFGQRRFVQNIDSNGVNNCANNWLKAEHRSFLTENDKLKVRFFWNFLVWVYAAAIKDFFFFFLPVCSVHLVA